MAFLLFPFLSYFLFEPPTGSLFSSLSYLGCRYGKAEEGERGETDNVTPGLEGEGRKEM